MRLLVERLIAAVALVSALAFPIGVRADEASDADRIACHDEIQAIKQDADKALEGLWKVLTDKNSKTAESRKTISALPASLKKDRAFLGLVADLKKATAERLAIQDEYDNGDYHRNWSAAKEAEDAKGKALSSLLRGKFSKPDRFWFSPNVDTHNSDFGFQVCSSESSPPAWRVCMNLTWRRSEGGLSAAIDSDDESLGWFNDIQFSREDLLQRLIYVRISYPRLRAPCHEAARRALLPPPKDAKQEPRATDSHSKDEPASTDQKDPSETHRNAGSASP